MSVVKHKRVKSDSLLDQIHGKDTEAFLEELVQDGFSDWHMGDDKKDTTQKIKREGHDRRTPSENLSGTNNVGQKPVQDTKKTAKRETSVSKTPTPIKTPSPQPQRKWTRFPTRLNSPDDKPPELQTTNSTCIETDQVDFSSRHIKTEPINHIDTMHGNDWEDESNAKLGITHKTMERYLENLWHDVKKRHEDIHKTRTRRTSTSSLESTASSSSSNSQDQGNDRKYLSALTEEELIDCKMKDVHEKFSDNICDNWADDVELALMIMKRQTKGRNIKSGEVKKLLNNILEQK